MAAEQVALFVAQTMPWHEHPIFVGVAVLVIGALLFNAARRGRDIHRAVMVTIPDRLDDGDERMGRIESTCEAAQAEAHAAATQAAVNAQAIKDHTEFEQDQTQALIEAIRAGKPVGRADDLPTGPKRR